MCVVCSVQHRLSPGGRGADAALVHRPNGCEGVLGRSGGALARLQIGQPRLDTQHAATRLHRDVIGGLRGTAWRVR